MYDDVLEVLHTLWKNGLSISALGTVVYVLLKQRRIKRKLRRYFPALFDDDSEVRAYVGNQQIIMENQRRMMGALGVDPVCPENVVISKTSRSLIIVRRMFSISFWAARLHARDAVARDNSFITNSTISNRRKMNMLKKWIRPDSLTIIGGVLAAAVTQYFGITIDPANIVAAAILLLGYFKANEYVTVVRDANGLPTGFKLNSRKFIFTGVAFALVVADIALKLNLSNELIFTITAAVTGYNYAEGKKDAKEAEHEGNDAKQTF